MKEKLLSFFGVFLSIMAVIGGIGTAVYNNSWVIAFSIAVLGVMAWSQFRKCFKNLIN